MASAQSEPVEIRTLSVEPMDNNVYLLTCRTTGESVIVDAANEAARIVREAEDTRVRYILQTHGHHDHVEALVEVKRALGARVGVHQGDASLLPLVPDLLLQDGDTVTFGKQKVRVLHTPGHTPGSICFSIDGYLISGDTLFPGGPGATAPPLGDFPRIIESIRSKLFILPDDTTVLPGHGLNTTLGLEKPHLQEWIARGW